MASNARGIWAERIARWERSGLTARVFAAREGVRPGTLTHWRWRLRRSGRPVADVRARSALSFVELAAPALAEAAACVEVVLPAGYRVRVPEQASSETLRTVFDVLEERR